MKRRKGKPRRRVEKGEKRRERDVNVDEGGDGEGMK